MKIDWKYVATTPGYKSLKAAYIKDARNAAKQEHPMRKKEVFLELFNWVICRAKHYAHKLDVPIDHILNKWEKDRTYWWLNYYQPGKQSKLHSKSLHYRKWKGLPKSKKHPARWSADCKKFRNL